VTAPARVPVRDLDALAKMATTDGRLDWPEAHDLIARCRAAEAEVAGLTARITTIADEAFGLAPVRPADDSLTAIERGIFELRRDAGKAEAEVSRLREQVATIVNDAEADWSNWSAVMDVVAKVREAIK